MANPGGDKDVADPIDSIGSIDSNDSKRYTWVLCRGALRRRKHYLGGLWQRRSPGKVLRPLIVAEVSPQATTVYMCIYVYMNNIFI